MDEISVTDLHERIRNGGVNLIDVREDREWAAGHVSGAVHVPLGTVPDNLARFDGSPTYVMCRSGARSMKACEFVSAQGLDVVNVTGGLIAWVDAGFDITAGAAGDVGGGAGG